MLLMSSSVVVLPTTRCNQLLVTHKHHTIVPVQRLNTRDKLGFEGDEDINTIVTPTAPAAIHTRPITRARARQLNYQVLMFLGNDSNVMRI